jgi:hypothetical protein
MQAWGSGATTPPPYTIPYEVFIAPLQTNVSQMEEETANIAYQIGRLHISPPE